MVSLKLQNRMKLTFKYQRKYVNNDMVINCLDPRLNINVVHIK